MKGHAFSGARRVPLTSFGFTPIAPPPPTPKPKRKTKETRAPTGPVFLPSLRFAAITREVALKHKVDVAEITGRSRSHRVCQARWEIMWRLQSEHGWSLPRIGRAMRLHHTTVLSGLRRHAAIREAQP